MRYPEDAGGLVLDLSTFCLALAEIARGSMSLAGCAAMQALMGTKFLQLLGNADILARLFKPALAGEKIGAICMTETNAGSDLEGIATTARKVDGGYVLDGQKTWGTGAPVADFFTVVRPGRRGEEADDLPGRARLSRRHRRARDREDGGVGAADVRARVRRPGPRQYAKCDNVPIVVLLKADGACLVVVPYAELYVHGGSGPASVTWNLHAPNDYKFVAGGVRLSKREGGPDPRTVYEDGKPVANGRAFQWKLKADRKAATFDHDVTVLDKSDQPCDKVDPLIHND